MKHIAWPSLAANRLRGGQFSRTGIFTFVVLTVVAAALNPLATASTRPKPGGTLRVQVSGRMDSLDPRQQPASRRKAAFAERVQELVFDRLTRLDEHGTLQPALAISWTRDDQTKRWQFRLREGVKFSDGTPLAPPVAAMALQQLLGISFDVSATSDSVVILADHSMPDLPMQLATGRYFVFRVSDDGSLFGTGPFRETLRESLGAAEMLTFVANESCWAGRPFVDKIDLILGANDGQQVNAIAFGQADVVELPASEVRRATQRGVHTVSSEPVELLALVLDPSRPSVQRARLRQAISLSIDRASIADVILQKEAVPAGGLLPNWISGYAHLFPATFDLERAKGLLADSGQEHSHSVPLVLAYDSGDAEAQAVADRVAVNLREAGIRVQVSGQIADRKEKPLADLRLVRHRLAMPDAAPALADLLVALGGQDSGTETPRKTPMETIDQIYAAERAPVDDFRVIPLVHVSESYGLSPQVRDWMAPRCGGWDLADVWLGPPAPGGNPQ